MTGAWIFDEAGLVLDLLLAVPDDLDQVAEGRRRFLFICI